MGTIADTPKQMHLSLSGTFAALKVLTDQNLISGLDVWRHSTGSDSLSSFDPDLCRLVQRQPPSKFGRAETPSLWTSTHFYLALPALSYVINKYGKEDTTTSALILQPDEITKYFIGFPHLIRLYREYREFVKLFGVPTEAWWNETLAASSGHIPTNASTTQVLESLPPYLREQASQVLAGKTDNLTGRIILAYLLSQGTSIKKLPFDNRSEHYVAPMHNAAPAKTLYERFVTAQLELGELDMFLENYDEEKTLRLDALLGLVQWFGRPHLVEMVIPGLGGAAAPVIRGLLKLFDKIVQNGGPDYTKPSLDELPSAQKFYATQSLNAIGRLSIMKDILSNDKASDSSDGTVLRQLGMDIYTEMQRLAAWGNPEYYIPNYNQDSEFKTYRQDIANIVYCAGLFTEHDNMSGTLQPDGLKQLARRLSRAKTSKGMRAAIHASQQALNELAIDWEMRYAGHERLRLLRFVRQTFGLDSIKPIPIPLHELNRGFAGSHFDGHVYHLQYQEAGEKLRMDITVQSAPAAHKDVRYHVLGEHDEPRITADDLPYSAWFEISTQQKGQPIIVPIPGRGSFDPFGRVGSSHGGEVIGFGCSVHHASLAIILAELASLGASRGDLEQVASAFMRINQSMHERYDLAAFQLAQIYAAFEDGVTYSYSDYLKSHSYITFDRSRPHLAAYVRIGKKSLAWAEPQAARWSYAYPALYPYRSMSTVNPRFSWYDGSPVELPEATVNWCVLTC